MIPMKKEWRPQQGFLPALSIQQPFTEAILQGKKTQEIRGWATHYTGLLVVHAGGSWYDNRKSVAAQIAMSFDMSLALESYPRGALVGVAHLIRCIRYTPESWQSERPHHRHDGAYNASYVGWQLVNIQRFIAPITYKGTLGLFSVPVEVIMPLLKDSRILEN